MKLAQVIDFPADNAGNIAAMLRQAADTIEGETEDDNRTEAIVAVQLHEDGSVQVYGWGRTETLKAIATLHLGAAKLVNGELEEDA